MAMKILFFVFSAVALVLIKSRISRKRPPLPPGPPADPLIGHLRLIPPTSQDLYFYEMSKIYGDVLHFNVLGRSLIVLNSVQAAVDLLDKRSTNYSDRPSLPIFELSGMGEVLVFMHYGKEFLIQRRMVQQYFAKNKARGRQTIQLREARVLAQNLMATPDRHKELMLRFSTATVIEITFGHRIVSDDDPYLKLADEFARSSTQTGPPGCTPVDLFPFLTNFPSWFPGTYYASFARAVKPTFVALHEYPYARVQEAMAAGSAKTSFLASQIESLRENDPDYSANVKRIQGAAAASYSAGADTTAGVLSFFLLAMVLYPEVQAMAQKELDTVVGTERLPEFHDRELLPYLECLLLETLRWNQVAPSGVPHKTLEDDIYNGMFIPKGSTVISNIRAMALDETAYKNPLQFDPTRFLSAPKGRGEPNPTAVFGFGRRICPGRFMADDSLWIAIATILSSVVISKVVGEDGKEVIPDPMPINSGVTSHPKPFQCRLEPRRATVLTLLDYDAD